MDHSTVNDVVKNRLWIFESSSNVVVYGVFSFQLYWGQLVPNIVWQVDFELFTLLAVFKQIMENLMLTLFGIGKDISPGRPVWVVVQPEIGSEVYQERIRNLSFELHHIATYSSRLAPLFHRISCKFPLRNRSLECHREAGRLCLSD